MNDDIMAEKLSELHEVQRCKSAALDALKGVDSQTPVGFVAEKSEEWLTSFQRENVLLSELSSLSPQSARAVGRMYVGENMPDKGKRDGSCNRSACQMPLAGNPQYVIRSTGDHYCQDCARKLNHLDAEMRRELRCELV